MYQETVLWRRKGRIKVGEVAEEALFTMDRGGLIYFDGVQAQL